MAIHGGDIYTDGILRGRKILDYSSNINPLGASSLVKENLYQVLDMAMRYPDIEYRQLKEDIITYNKKYFNTKIYKDDLIIGNGATEIIDETIKTLRKILIIAPSFAEYEICAKKHKAEIIYSYLDENMKFNYEDILKKFKECDGLIITNPNNPNGGIVDKDNFKDILNLAEKNGKIVIVDEAFIEMTDFSKSLISLIYQYQCLFIIRAITKFFGLPGVRFGYGISKNKKVLEVIKDHQLPWNINSLAELSVKYALSDEVYINKSKEWINNESRRFVEALRKIDIIERVYDTRANFCLCKLKGVDENQLYNYCFENDIAIRRCSNFKGLNEKFVRFAIKDKESNDKFIEVLRIYKRMR